MNSLANRLRKLRTTGGIAGLTITAIVAAAIPGVALTNASWNDTEFVHGTVGSEDCSTATNFSTRGAGKLLSGSIGAINLDTLASVNGVVVNNGASGPSVFPSGATSLGSDAYANPLQVTALSTIDANLGTLLQLPLNTDAGALNQYAQAHSNGSSTRDSSISAMTKPSS